MKNSPQVLSIVYIFTISGFFFLIFSGFFYFYFKGPSYDKCQAELLAESGLHYALNRIEHAGWLCDSYWDWQSEYARNREMEGTHRDFLEKGHYLHFKNQNPREVWEQYNLGTSVTSVFSDIKKNDGCGFYVWAEPIRYHENGQIFKNGEWIIRSRGIFQNSVYNKSCVIKTETFQSDFAIFADRIMEMNGTESSSGTVYGRVWSNGYLVLGTNASIISDEKTVVLGNASIEGFIDGDLATSSVVFPDSIASVPASNYVSGHIELANGYERYRTSEKRKGHYSRLFRLKKIWSGSHEDHPRLREYCRCSGHTLDESIEFIDAFNAIDCITGFNGTWKSEVSIYDYPALAASRIGEFPDKARVIASKLLSLKQIRSIKPDSGSFQKNITSVFEPKSPSFFVNDIFAKPLPVFNWKYARDIAMNSAELDSSSYQGIIFNSWDEFSCYINNPDNSLVHHILNDTDTHRKIIVGNYDVERHQYGKPIVIYITKDKNDKGKPDRGCFRVDYEKAELIINGSLISERSLDLRDFHPENPEDGRWREYTTGKDGRVVAFCGGIPMIRATDSGDCAMYGIYKWCRDGAQQVIIKGHPDFPALAVQGDFWVIGRHYQLTIEGLVFAPFGHTLFCNQEIDHSKPAVRILGGLIGRDIECIGSFFIASDSTNTNLPTLNVEDPWQIRIIDWDPSM
ncbi:hypothetical protein JW979_16540 [bacterium]|nr:hypothetical protein [candidate division CSSED10-310 bacterium]